MDQIATATIDGPDTTGTATLFETEMNYVIQLHDMDIHAGAPDVWACLLYTSPSPRDATLSRMPSSA